jgi:tetratricopeptide (TPR) repeat protein
VTHLREYRERYGLTQDEVIDEVRKRARARGDRVVPGLDQPALSKHENGHKQPGPYYRALYCEVFGATPAELGFRLALPGEARNHPDVNRREFIAGTAGLAVTAALPIPPQRIGQSDVERLRQSVLQLYKLDDQHGAGVVYPLAERMFHRLRGLVDRASYSPATGQALRELTAQTVAETGWLSFDAGRHDDARRWWLEAMHWARLAESDSVGTLAMTSMARQAFDRGRSREAIEFAQSAQRMAKTTATPRLMSLLLAREAIGHARAGDRTNAHAAIARASRLADHERHDDDPAWLAFYDSADFASHEHRVALALGDYVAAEDAARSALALGDPVDYPRNHALDLTNLAYVLVQRREIDEGVAVATRAAVAASDLDSGRINQGLHTLAKKLAPFTNEPNVREFLSMN